MGGQSRTPDVTVFDPRGLEVGRVAYWRCAADLPVQPRTSRTLHDAAARAVKQWDARLWAQQAIDPLTVANLQSVFSLRGEVLRTEILRTSNWLKWARDLSFQ